MLLKYPWNTPLKSGWAMLHCMVYMQIWWIVSNLPLLRTRWGPLNCWLLHSILSIGLRGRSVHWHICIPTSLTTHFMHHSMYASHVILYDEWFSWDLLSLYQRAAGLRYEALWGKFVERDDGGPQFTLSSKFCPAKFCLSFIFHAALP